MVMGMLCCNAGGHALQDDGYVAKILVPAGTKDIKVNTVVGIIVEEKDDVRRLNQSCWLTNLTVRFY